MEHPDYAAIRVTLEVLNATESYLWVSLNTEYPWLSLSFHS
jgi:hypothetical protein